MEAVVWVRVRDGVPKSLVLRRGRGVRKGPGKRGLLSRAGFATKGEWNVLPSHPLVRAVSIPSGVWCCIVLHTCGMRGTLC